MPISPTYHVGKALDHLRNLPDSMVLVTKVELAAMADFPAPPAPDEEYSKGKAYNDAWSSFLSALKVRLRMDLQRHIESDHRGSYRFYPPGMESIEATSTRRTGTALREVSKGRLEVAQYQPTDQKARNTQTFEQDSLRILEASIQTQIDEDRKRRALFKKGKTTT